MNVRAEAERLRLIPVFAECDPAHLQVLLFSAERVDFAPGQAILRRGESGAAGFLILQGSAEATIEEDGARRTIARLEPGCFAGELAMIAGQAATVTLTAISQLRAARIGRELFLRLAQEFPDFALAVQRGLARKLGGTVGEIASVKPLFDAARSFSRLKIE